MLILILNSFYFEIGVNDGCSFRLVAENTNAIGVDPSPNYNSTSYNHKIISTTSDVFFQNNSFSPELSFIDGLHTAHQVTVDFVNTYNSSPLGGWIVVDDILPESLFTCQPFRVDSIWHGDVYKFIFVLKQFWSFLNPFIINCKPGGLAFIKKTHSDLLSLDFDLTGFLSSISSSQFMLKRDHYFQPVSILPSQLYSYLDR